MKLAIVSDVFPPKSGGSGWSSFYLARALQQRGHQVQVVVPRESNRFGQAEREYEGLPITEFLYRAAHVPFIRNYSRNEQLYPRMAEFLADFFRRHDIMLAHGQHYLTIPPVVMAAQQTGIASVATVRDYWPTCYWTTQLSGDRVCPGCTELNRLKCLYRNQGAAGIVAAPVSLYMAANLRLKQSWLAQADRTLAVSDYVAGKLRPFVRADRLEVVPNFVDLARLHSAIQAPPSTPEAARPYLLYVGKFEENKGVRLLIETLRRVRPTLPTLAVGDGSLRSELEAAGAELNLKVVGWKDNDEVLRLIHQAEALVFPSLWPEPLSRVLLEAMGVGACVVALNTGGTPDVIQDGRNGRLAATPSELADRLQTTLAAPQAERDRLRAGASQTAQSCFSQTVVVDRVEQIYNDLAAGRNLLRKVGL